MTTEDQQREFELVLGNKQLFVVLLIVVVLLGLFFAMGYVMGRSSVPTEVGTRKAEPARAEGSEAARRPAVDTPAPVSATPAVAPSSGSGGSYPLPTPPANPPAPSKPLEVAPVSVAEPAPGTVYLQVSAVAKPEAELLVEVLVRKGFKAMIAPGPNDKVFRVLVGPARDQAELGKMKGDLEQSGFKSMVRKY
jgi:cell division septation protein DedD